MIDKLKDSYRIIKKDHDRYDVYSINIGMNVLENISYLDLLYKLANELEYTIKLQMIQKILTFPDGYITSEKDSLSNPDGVAMFNSWYKKTYQHIVNIDTYQTLIDEKLVDLLNH